MGSEMCIRDRVRRALTKWLLKSSSYFFPVPLTCFAAALLARDVKVFDLTWPPDSRAALDSMRAAASIVMGRGDAGALVDCMVVPFKVRMKAAVFGNGFHCIRAAPRRLPRRWFQNWKKCE